MPQDNAERPDATWVIDGIEGHFARVELEDGETVDMALASLPRGVREGDVIRVHLADGDFTLEIDHAETQRQREAAQTQLDALNRTAPAGEIDL
ncbi:hypothetical protein DEIPH_ctg014orf0005 [Deinococcus phoenicis]|uniref:DUF3006 domain-containing protein n=1 Tax=Deinococcus phoenicis TaxID=1476583 RepID=A0A016QS36_9DEIO|nr:DUF3006 domain-containing protein [Deinococcus phoenicis]EYB68878.1 hypothetical protein DEIPH_ctg014orf0005 [Deinococcus phoenicis]